MTDTADRKLGKLLALDIGQKRIGVAVSDFHQILASPYTVLLRTPSTGDIDIFGQICQLILDFDCALLVVGLPIDLRGESALAAQSVQKFTARLSKYLAKNLAPDMFERFDIVFSDERMSTKLAQQQFLAVGKKTRDTKNLIDAQAAAVILQQWLDTHR